MESGHPILLIVTNRECSHCEKLRGQHGWPSDKLPSGIIPPRKDGEQSSWNESFFRLALTGGIKDHTQRARVIELHYDRLQADPNLIEVTFFDINPVDHQLVVKKYRADCKNMTMLLKKNRNGFIDTKEIPVKFVDFIKKYVAYTQIKRYLHVFPSYMYVHSTIWNEAIKDPKASLYLRVQGFQTVRDGHNHKIYKILKETRANPLEKDRNPIDVLRKLIAFDLVPLFFPADH